MILFTKRNEPLAKPGQGDESHVADFALKLVLFADDLHVFQATLETVSDLAVSKHAILFVGGKIAVATPVRFATHHSHTIHQRFPDSRDTAIRICRCVTFTLTNQRIHDY